MWLMFYREGGSQTTRGWLAHATPLLINCLIGDTLLINLVIDSQAPNVLIQVHISTDLHIDRHLSIDLPRSRHASCHCIACALTTPRLANLVSALQRGIIAHNAKTQLAMNRAYVLDADIWLAFRLQLAAKVILLTLMFSSAMPALFAIVGLYCWSAHFIDKLVLFRVMRRPPHAQNLRLMYYMVCWLLPLAVIVRLCFAVFVYLGLRCGCVEEAALIAAGSFSDGAPLLPASTRLEPVQWIVLISSAVLAFALFLFLARETVHICRSRRVRKMRKRTVTRQVTRSLKDGARPSMATAPPPSETTTSHGQGHQSYSSMRSSAVMGTGSGVAGAISNLVATAFTPTGEQRPSTQQLVRAKTQQLVIRRVPTSTISSRSGSGSQRQRGISSSRGSNRGSNRDNRGSNRDSGLGRAVSFGPRSVSFKLDGTRKRAGTGASQGGDRVSTRSHASSVGGVSVASTTNERAFSFRRGGGGLAATGGRQRTSSATAAGRYVLPDASQMYLPPLTMLLMQKLTVLDPLHAQRAKVELQRRREKRADQDGLRESMARDTAGMAAAAWPPKRTPPPAVAEPPPPPATSNAETAQSRPRATSYTHSRLRALSSKKSKLGRDSPTLSPVPSLSPEGLDRTSASFESYDAPGCAPYGAPDGAAKNGVVRLGRVASDVI